MEYLPVVENPRRKRRRSRASRSRRRRNPALAMLAGNPRRKRGRRSSRRSRSYFPRRFGRRHRNPAFFAGLDLPTAGFVAAGGILVKVGPGLIAKVWPGIPRTGIAGYGVKVGIALASGFLVKMVASPSRANQVMTGALAMILIDGYNEFVAPKLGLSGLGINVPQSELDQILGPGVGRMGGYIYPAPGMNGLSNGQAERDVILAG